MKDVLARLSRVSIGDTFTIGSSEIKAIEKITHALENCTPKPVTEGLCLADCVFYVYPGCNMTMEREYQAYCDRCGQKLKWGNMKRIKFR